MQGKILADGLISGVDGKRYTFTASDFKSAQGKSARFLVGSEVDFEGKDGKASDIYITKSSINNKILSTDLQGIKLKAYAMIACVVLTPVPFIGQIADIAAFVLGFFVVLGVKAQSQSATIFKNWLKQLILFFIASGFGLCGGLLYMGGEEGGSFFFMLCFWILFFFHLRYYYLYAKELAYVTNEKMFIYAFWFYAPLITGVIAAVLYVIAWVRTQEIHKSYSATS